ncbi:hypothetical protein HYPSUDRAFT_37189 [Hypholoma sublateritium FD-334 SS-4]|uniref:Alginate lyase domain-containing protein n=1 Tax=Hypholoma sublateritium (strain FD-334 SS-4) TaxID=945553 RepID=A0A0D2Q2G5_HYPSF|nr:hypothetical protein HYPSUDRAFT_37189 [Hypholoma sublateritium FD-334 SS-4]
MFLQNLPLRVITVLFSLQVVFVLGDPNDWVNVDYVISQAAKEQSRSDTVDARATIVRNAGSSAGKGPWTITNSKGDVPPSKDPHDYLSWAPYHWPDCNWCTQTAGRTHLAHTVAGPGQNNSDSNGTISAPFLEDPYSNESVLSRRTRRQIKHRRSRILFNIDLDLEELADPVPPVGPDPSEISALSSVELPTSSTLTLKPTSISTPTATITSAASTSSGRAYAPAKAAAKPTKTSCTPTPTKALAPSATWTTCPYVGRDGQVNPDVRDLNGPDAINDASQAVIYNAIAYALEGTSTYSKNVANLINTFFLAPDTKMNPNMNFGQIVRGPGPDGVSGTFTGILDLRGIVKIINGIAIIKAAGSPDWTQVFEQQMKAWLTDYVNWLKTSSIGQITASRPNNHGTFYTSQVAAAKMSSGDQQGAALDLQAFFAGPFLDQVAQSGEQPFEAIRTRPYHYRNFNLEALITNAKLGDQIGLNLWIRKSKYGATIQTALDFVLTLNPGNEDRSLVFPHVASVSAAYGDPTGKYAAFLRKNDPTYQSKPYYFYDQPVAIPNSPAATKQGKRFSRKRDGTIPDIPFECPAVFQGVVKVEIANGVFVTCDELRPLYN